MRTVGLIPRSALAIEKAGKIMGSETILAKRIGIRRQKLNYWKSYMLLPCDKAMEIYTVTAGRVSFYELRPDLIFVIRRFVLLFLKELTDKEKISFPDELEDKRYEALY